MSCAPPITVLATVKCDAGERMKVWPRVEKDPGLSSAKLPSDAFRKYPGRSDGTSRQDIVSARGKRAWLGAGQGRSLRTARVFLSVDGGCWRSAPRRSNNGRQSRDTNRDYPFRARGQIAQLRPTSPPNCIGRIGGLEPAIMAVSVDRQGQTGRGLRDASARLTKGMAGDRLRQTNVVV